MPAARQPPCLEQAARALTVALATDLLACTEAIRTPEVPRAEVLRAAQAVQVTSAARPEIFARGKSYTVDATSAFDVMVPPGATTSQTQTLGDLANACTRAAAEPRGSTRLPGPGVAQCPETADAAYRLRVPVSVPDWRAIAGWSIVGGVVAGEVACFAECGTTGRDVLIGVDVGVVVLAIAGVILLVDVVKRATRD